MKIIICNFSGTFKKNILTNTIKFYIISKYYKYRGVEQLAARRAHKIVSYQIQAIIFFVYISIYLIVKPIIIRIISHFSQKENRRIKKKKMESNGI